MKEIKLTADEYCDASAEITRKLAEKQPFLKMLFPLAFAALANKLFGDYDEAELFGDGEVKEIVLKEKEYRKIAIDTATDLSMDKPEIGLVITLGFVALAKKLFHKEEESVKKITLTEFFDSEKKLAIHCKSPDEAK